MHRREDGKTERARKDHDVLALPTVCPGGASGWSFRRGGKVKPENWYVKGEDVDERDLRDP